MVVKVKGMIIAMAIETILTVFAMGNKEPVLKSKVLLTQTSPTATSRHGLCCSIILSSYSLCCSRQRLWPLEGFVT